MDVNIEPSWKQVLEQEFEQDYFAKLSEFVKKEYRETVVYPPPRFIFHAFELTPFEQVRVVILGQDPYHGEGQANGLCFAVRQGMRLPPSLQNIYKEIESDLGHKPQSQSGDLEEWAKQGVLLLNATLTVRAHSAGSHQNVGWEQFTDGVVKVLSEQKENLVFILWGAYAQKKGSVIDEAKHMVIRSAHPSPFSAYSGFFGSKPFSRCNEYLFSHGELPIAW
ncbi:MAG: Uracil-DNA glycosylase [Microgenomates group bacterium GW2011_GWA2_46_7]|nr:MAG: Uracil-DNA glycosylase [Microgenomates group bacterium GW2011_GWA2_46_7]